MKTLRSYSAYKPSGVYWLGNIPAHWQTRRLKSVIESSIAGTWGEDPTEHNIEDHVRCIRVADFNIAELRVTDLAKTYRAIPQEQRFRRILRSGDILLEKSGGGDQQPVGRVVLFTGDEASVTSNFVTRLRPDHRQVTSRYLLYLLDHLHRTRVVVPSIKQTTGIQNLDERSYLFESFSLPPLDEQHAIAAFLDAMDERVTRFIDARRRMIALLEEQKQAIITQAVTKGLDPDVPMKPSGIDWLGDVPAHWDVVALRYRYSVLLGKMLDTKQITGTNLRPYLRNVDVQWGRIHTLDLPRMDIEDSEMDRYSALPGDLLVCEGGEVGRSAVWRGSGPICYQKALHRLRPWNQSTDTTEYLYYVMKSTAEKGVFAGQGNENTFNHLTGEAFRAYRFGFPPLAEQLKIVSHIHANTTPINTIIARHYREIELVQEYRTRLISDVVTGKLDVRGWQLVGGDLD